MDAHPTEVTNILAGPKQYAIPVFQRYYSWTEDKWSTLWDDVRSLVDNQQDQATHFIGPFILIQRSRSHSFSQYTLVIDGQQRLITLTLALCALRDKAYQLNLNELGDSIHENSIMYRDNRGQYQPKIIPRSQDRREFSRIVSKEAIVDSTKRVAEAYRFFCEALDTAVQEQGGPLWVTEYLQSLYEALTNRLGLVSITLDDSDNPSNVYESLNFKGQTLSDSDLIRNFVFMQLPLEEQDKFDSEIWRSFESVFQTGKGIDASRLTDFYYRYLTFRLGYFSKGLIYRKFMDYFYKEVGRERILLIDSLEPFVADLRMFGQYYIDILNVESDVPELRAAFKRFDLLGVQDTAMPLLLAMYHEYSPGRERDKKRLAVFLSKMSALESIVLRRSILRMRTRGYGSLFAKAATMPDRSLLDLEMFLARHWPKDEDVRLVLEEYAFYHFEPSKCHLVLLEIERALGGKETIDPSNLTIEHVMPQKLTPEWNSSLGSDVQELHQRYKDTLGNLTLTAYNAEISNRPFADKKNFFGASRVVLNEYFCDCEQWGFTEIRERSKRLADQFLRIWPRPLSIATVEASEPEPGFQLSFDLQ